ncbi:MAG: hypothetical protein A2268_01350 [Candidatus Raymondbacteria bacterium RifOxyA12_full_50_37]|uniref:Transcription factor zinc-finger domain-containing protein n=1 Tax=Candidatus Raymondbacteria bacterium RIFOXYD12_FULL_49_13 TaxID=1817890 RepID=A0A1F7FH09_UNCRA|nr:MAG: hypothetical protein A2268_01350 [Candidatus Raymondbacteria bacterium RifOxyA12_full_50_37]OGJ92432.1 MAG: hypothetical protein A2248_11645 [Candidatus Raymondbacteria bacterium RIFOXYA2_FULL_49_16]OGJ98853.1 MAG: hypothetical protein A2453_01075 [Candidatus Raymondbacteria bacterium RIFOXYC2_FULL_50_21]OGK03582.1 MAG: hypothetical protein A2350_09905 [Candidatus Raymondbacteria bacterium RifOxyB12_full_50_8]OGK04693.1 MAG: hypothetical protein A2487_14215 [Candidatus Raymondbacteria b
MPVKPTPKEEEYFARKEFERKKRLEEEKHREMKAVEKKRLKELHHMSCPKCGMGLIEMDYKHIKIDKCSECGGIWLDHGELEEVLNLEQSFISKFFNVFK